MIVKIPLTEKSTNCEPRVDDDVTTSSSVSSSIPSTSEDPVELDPSSLPVADVVDVDIRLLPLTLGFVAPLRLNTQKHVIRLQDLTQTNKGNQLLTDYQSYKIKSKFTNTTINP